MLDDDNLMPKHTSFVSIPMDNFVGDIFVCLREAEKKVILVARPLRPYPPPSFVAKESFF